MKDQPQVIYHLVPTSYYQNQPVDAPYCPETYAQDGFIHCTAGQRLLVEIANSYFLGLNEPLLVLVVNPARLTAVLKYEPPIPPAGDHAHTPDDGAMSSQDSLFPHIYGPLNRDAIVDSFLLERSPGGLWQLPQ